MSRANDPPEELGSSGKDSKKSNTALAKMWETRVRKGEEYRERYGHSKMWEVWTNAYRGNWDKDIVPVNKTFSFIRSMVPRTYFRNPFITITPTRPEFMWRARIIEKIDNQLVRETGLKQTLKSVVLKAGLTGTGTVKLGFDSEFGYNPAQALTVDGETATQIGTESGSYIETNQNIKPGMPWAMPVSSDNIVVPWGYRASTSLPWIAHTLYRSLDDVKNDQKYNKNKLKLQGGYSRNVAGKMGDPLLLKDGVYCRLVEIRDLRRRKVLVISEGKVLLEMDDALQIEGPNFEFLIFNEDPDLFWGLSDVKMLWPQQQEVNEIRTSASKHRRISVLKFLYILNSMEKEDIEKLTSGDMVTSIGLKGDSIDNVVKILTPHIPPDLYTDQMQVERDSREIMGYSSNQAGEFSGRSTPPTATEVVSVDRGSGIRTDERRDVVADLFMNIMRKWNQYIGTFWTTEKVVQIVGPSGAPEWVSYKGSDLVGEYDLKIDPDSTTPMSREMKMKMGMQAFQMFNGDPFTDQVLLRWMVMRNFAALDPSFEMVQKPPQNPNPPTPGMLENLGKKQSFTNKPGGSPERPKSIDKVI